LVGPRHVESSFCHNLISYFFKKSTFCCIMNDSFANHTPRYFNSFHRYRDKTTDFTLFLLLLVACNVPTMFRLGNIIRTTQTPQRFLGVTTLSGNPLRYGTKLFEKTLNGDKSCCLLKKSEIDLSLFLTLAICFDELCNSAPNRNKDSPTTESLISCTIWTSQLDCWERMKM